MVWEEDLSRYEMVWGDEKNGLGGREYFQTTIKYVHRSEERAHYLIQIRGHKGSNYLY